MNGYFCTTLQMDIFPNFHCLLYILTRLQYICCVVYICRHIYVVCCIFADISMWCVVYLQTYICCVLFICRHGYDGNGNQSPQPEKKKPHIKKPLNAFMLFMKEQRAKVVAECTLKESAAINQILGRRVSYTFSLAIVSLRNVYTR